MWNYFQSNVYVVHMDHKWILCGDLDSIPKLSHYVYMQRFQIQ